MRDKTTVMSVEGATPSAETTMDVHVKEKRMMTTELTVQFAVVLVMSDMLFQRHLSQIEV